MDGIWRAAWWPVGDRALVTALFFTAGTIFARGIAALKEERGATALEYAFVASLISIAIYVAAGTIGTNLSSTFNSVATKL